MSTTTTLTAACKCKGNQFALAVPSSSFPLNLSICHCTTCRTSMGTSFATYFVPPVPFAHNGQYQPFLPSQVPATITRYKSSNTAARYFCSICGAHMFMHYGGEDAVESSQSVEDKWWLASGVVDIAHGSDALAAGMFKTVSNIWIDATGDCGLAFLTSHPILGTLDAVTSIGTDSKSSTISELALQQRLRRCLPSSSPSESYIRKEPLTAQCHCHAVNIFMSNPDVPESYPPVSYEAWHESMDRTEGSDDAYWMRPSLTKPGKRDRLVTIPCACNHCRRATGSEFVSWTYTPTGCLSVKLLPKSTTAAAPDTKIVPWNTITSLIPQYTQKDPSTSSASASKSLPGDLSDYTLPFKIYHSSIDVWRGFCGTCGATVFWRGILDDETDKRVNMIDISGGLFSHTASVELDSVADERGDVARGSRRDDWLDWRADRLCDPGAAEGRGDLVGRMTAGLQSTEWREALGL